MKSEKFIVIGITDAPKPFFTPEVLDIIKQGKVFSGGKRHHEIVAPFLPEDAQWIDIVAPLDTVFEQYYSLFTSHFSLPIIVFASGDPLFFGFANTIKRKMPEAEIKVYPTFNSLQLLAHRLLMPYHDMRTVSLTGRPWQEFDKALIERTPKMGILTDREHTPAAIAQRMLEYGYNDYLMYIGEHLGNPELEKISHLSLDEVALSEFSQPNCVILHPFDFGPSALPLGIPDSAFTLLDGREKMITKMPIRLLTLQALELYHRHEFWDIGACTGSISIEARLHYPHLHVFAFEVRPECEAIIQENARKFGAPGIEVIMGDFLEVDCDALPREKPANPWVMNSFPDAIFIGGHNGQLKEIMAKACSYLSPTGIIVMNSVTSPVVEQMTNRPSSRQLWDEACAELGLHQEPPLRIVLNDHNPIEILRAKK